MCSAVNRLMRNRHVDYDTFYSSNNSWIEKKQRQLAYRTVIEWLKRKIQCQFLLLLYLSSSTWLGLVLLFYYSQNEIKPSKFNE